MSHNDILNIFDMDIKTDDYDVYVDIPQSDEIKLDVILSDILSNKHHEDLFVFLKKYNDYSKIENIKITIDILLFVIQSFKKYQKKYIIYAKYLHTFFGDNPAFLTHTIHFLNSNNKDSTIDYDIFLDRLKYLLCIKYISIYFNIAFISCSNNSDKDYDKYNYIKSLIFEIYYFTDNLNYNIFFDQIHSKFHLFNNIYKVVSSNKDNNSYQICKYTNGPINNNPIINFIRSLQFINFVIITTNYLKSSGDLYNIDNIFKIYKNSCIEEDLIHINDFRHLSKTLYICLYYNLISPKILFGIIGKQINTIPLVKYFRELFNKLPVENIAENVITTLYTYCKKTYSIENLKTNNYIMYIQFSLYNEIIAINKEKLQHNYNEEYFKFITKYNNLITEKQIYFDNNFITYIYLYVIGYIYTNFKIEVSNTCDLDSNIKYDKLTLTLRDGASYNDIIDFYSFNNLINTFEYNNFLEKINIDLKSTVAFSPTCLANYFIKICIPDILNNKIDREIVIEYKKKYASVLFFLDLSNV